MSDTPAMPPSEPVTLERTALEARPAHDDRPVADAPPPATEAARAQEIEAATPTGYVSAVLTGAIDGREVKADILTLLPGRWKASPMRILREGEMDAFMETILTEDGYDTYLELDPTQDQLGEFMADLSKVAGESVGKSSGRPGSSRRTRKR